VIIKKNALVIIAVAILFFHIGIIPLFSSPSAEKSNEGYTVTDALGRDVSFSKVPSRIVLAGKAVFMVADAYYLFFQEANRLTAVGEINQGKGNFLKFLDPNYEDITVLNGGAGPEQIAAVNPDTVVLKSFLRESMGKAVEQLGIPVIYVSFESPEEYQRDIRVYGQLIQRTERAEKVASYYKNEREDIVETLEGHMKQQSESEKPNALLLYYSSRGGEYSFNVPPAAWMQTKLVEMAGGNPVWKANATGKGWNRIGFEQIAAWDPDYIFLVAYHNDIDEVMKKLSAEKNWQQLRAYKEERLLAVPLDYYSYDQPDTRWLLGLKWMAKTFYPSLFEEMDFLEEVREFYTFLYGMDRKEITEVIEGTLQGDL
jgi:iron complex transport system substrate-binding protein